MKRLSTIIMALAVIMGMTRCTKPAMQLYDGTYTGVTKEITFTTGGSSKVEINNVLNELKFTWKTGDTLYVYGSKTGTFSDGRYCGKLGIVKGMGTENGFFSGTLENVPETGKLRFYYCPKELFDKEQKTITVDLSSQNGSLNDPNGIASHLVACADVTVMESGDYSATLTVPYSVVKLDLSAFGTTDITMSGITNSGLTVTANGVKNVSTGGITSLSGADVTTNTCYVSVMPENVTALNFSGNGKVGSKAVTLSENKFETLDDAGDPVTVPSAKSPVSVKSTGLCSISSTAVSFSGDVDVFSWSTAQGRFFVVYSSSNSNPTLGGTGCTKSCESDPETMCLPSKGEFTIDVTGLTSGVTYYYRAYVKYNNSYYIAAPDVRSIDLGATPQAIPSNWNGGGTPGASPKVFTVGRGNDGVAGTEDDVKVRFSQGNLQYIGSAATPYWKFAEHQFDYLGLTTGQNSASETVDRDLFGWGTSGWDNGNHFYQPYDTDNSTYGSSVGFGYGPTNGSSYNFNLTGDYANSDWGVYNAIDAGGISTTGWRTLTRDEWDYLLYRRTDASSKWALGKVGSCTGGMIILPDDWTLPAGCSFTGGVTDYDTNVYSYAQWHLMETAGAVFLPAAGSRIGTSIWSGLKYGVYWSSSLINTYYASCLFFSRCSPFTDSRPGRYTGCSVRLVR